jgi:glucose repression regulatory protein TUP1
LSLNKYNHHADLCPLQIWDIAKGQIQQVFYGHQQEVRSLDFSRDGRFIISGSGDKTVRIWDLCDKFHRVLTISDDDDSQDPGISSVTISPDATLVAAGHFDASVRIWDVATGALLERLRGHKDGIRDVAFTSDGKGLVSGSLDKSVKYWDVSVLAAASAKASQKM